MATRAKDGSRFHVELSIAEAEMLMEAMTVFVSEKKPLGHFIDALALRERLKNNLFYAKQRAKHHGIRSIHGPGKSGTGGDETAAPAPLQPAAQPHQN